MCGVAPLESTTITSSISLVVILNYKHGGLVKQLEIGDRLEHGFILSSERADLVPDGGLHTRSLGRYFLDNNSR